MEQKTKLREIAKDLKMTPADVISLLKEYMDVEKKITSTLTAEEASIVLEKFSQTHEVSDFKEYFSTKKEKEKEQLKSADKETISSKPLVNKTTNSLNNPQKNTQPKKADNTIKNIRPNAISNPVKGEAKTTNTLSKDERPRNVHGNGVKDLKAKNLNSPQNNKQTLPSNTLQNKIQRNDTGKPINSFKKEEIVKGSRNEKFAKRLEGANNPVKQSAENPQAKKEKVKPVFEKQSPVQKKPKILPKPLQPVVDIEKLKVNEPPKNKIKGETVQRGEQVTKRVDTRGSYVELDKYNERYEKIAPQTAVNNRFKNDNFTKKQKINQKSQQNRRGRNVKQFETEAQKLRRLELERARKQQLKVLIPDEILVSELASRLKVTAADVIKRLFKLGVMASISQTVDFDTASLVAEELGAKVEHEKIITIEERLFEDIEDTDENLQSRSPVVVVMGHVDHGKTSLLDRIRNAHVAEGEAGGITQHIGAYRVRAGERDITFLDTPGHEAFTAMRARGASITDIAIIVVAADDGIMPQTIEAIDHAKAADVSIIVAVNKIDKEGASPERVKQELTEHGLVPEEWGGDVICVNVSAKVGTGIDNLLEMVNLTADFRELKGNPERLAIGAVIEAKLDKGRGPVATLLVQKGTLRVGDTIIAGTSVGRVRVMRNDKGRSIKEAGLSVPVEIMGLSEVPSAGDSFAVVADEKLARELAEKRRHEAKEAKFNLYRKVTLDNLFEHIEDGTVKELPLIVKADVQGSVEAVKQSLEKLSGNEVRVRVIHGGVGAVNESDVMLANASNAIIIGFNVRPNPIAMENAKRDDVDMRLYRIIYDAIEEVQTAMKGLLAPKYREIDMARIDVRNVFKITGVGAVAGCYILNGKVQRSCQIRVVRDGIIVNVDKIDSLKRFKDDVKEVAQGYECGISLQSFSDFKEGDIFEAFMVEEYRD